MSVITKYNIYDTNNELCFMVEYERHPCACCMGCNEDELRLYDVADKVPEAYMLNLVGAEMKGFIRGLLSKEYRSEEVYD